MEFQLFHVLEKPPFFAVFLPPFWPGGTTAAEPSKIFTAGPHRHRHLTCGNQKYKTKYINNDLRYNISISKYKKNLLYPRESTIDSVMCDECRGSESCDTTIYPRLVQQPRLPARVHHSSPLQQSSLCGTDPTYQLKPADWFLPVLRCKLYPPAAFLPGRCGLVMPCPTRGASLRCTTITLGLNTLLALPTLLCWNIVTVVEK